MLNRLEHVFNSYFGGTAQQVGSAISLFVWFVVIVSAFGPAGPEHANELSMHIRVFISMFPLSFFAIVIGSRLKQQFSNPRARLTPNYVWPHLLVAAGLLSAVAFVSLIIGILNHGNILTIVGVYGLALLVMAWGGSFSLSRVPVIVVASVVVIIGPLLYFSETALRFLNDFWKGKYPPLSALLLVTTAVGFYFYAKRIVALNEEDENYSTPSLGENYLVARGKKPSPEYQRMVGQAVERNRYTCWAIDLIFKHTNLRYHNGQLWRHAMLYNFNSWLRLPVLLLLYPAVIFGLVSILNLGRHGELRVVMLTQLLILPVIAISQSERQHFLQRRPYSIFEFLRPASRRQLANVIACSTFINVGFQIIVWMLSAIFIVGVIEPKILTVQILTHFLLLNVLSVLLTTGMALWMGTLRPFWQYIVACVVLFVLVMVPHTLFLFSFHENNIALIAFGYVTVVLMSLLLIYGAHHRWKNMEWA